MEFPKASRDLLPDLYEKLDRAKETAERVLRTHFRIENEGDVEIVRFGEATEDEFLESMYEAPAVMVPFL